MYAPTRKLHATWKSLVEFLISHKLVFLYNFSVRTGNKGETAARLLRSLIFYNISIITLISKKKNYVVSNYGNLFL